MCIHITKKKQCQKNNEPLCLYFKLNPETLHPNRTREMKHPRDLQINPKFTKIKRHKPDKRGKYWYRRERKMKSKSQRRKTLNLNRKRGNEYPK